MSLFPPPQGISDLVFPSHEATVACQAFVSRKRDNLLLYGATGTGKSAAARALMGSRVPDLLPQELVVLNASVNRSVADVDAFFGRFWSTGWNSQGVICGIVNEVDCLTGVAEGTLKGRLDELADQGLERPLIFTTNHPGELEPALMNRMFPVEWNVPPAIMLLPWVVKHLMAAGRSMDDDKINNVIANSYGRIRSIIQNFD